MERILARIPERAEAIVYDEKAGLSNSHQYFSEGVRGSLAKTQEAEVAI